MQTIFATGDNPLSFLNDFGVEWDLLISQAISFALVAAALYYFAFKPVIAKANERRQIIEKGLQDAESARKELEKSQEQANQKLAAAAAESSEILRKSRDEAKRQIEAASAEAVAKAAQIREKAEKQLESDKARMKEELKAELSELVVKATEAVVAEVLTDTQRSELAKIAAKKLGETK